MEGLHLSPSEITDRFVEAGVRKGSLPLLRMALLGLLGGAFIAFAAEGSNVAIHTVQSVGLGKALAGALFATGLMMVVLAGAELFTGNMIMIVSAVEGRLPWSRLLMNWSVVYLANLAGSVLIAACILLSGQLDFSGGLLGGFTIRLAAYKTGLTFSRAFFMGILCNWLVCMAVWMAGATKDIGGKLLAIFFPIWLFIASGFEHSVANMYYIPAGILAKADPRYLTQAFEMGVSAASLDNLNWMTFVTRNLVPVTLGNMVGGIVFVGLIFWISFPPKRTGGAG